MQTSSRKTVSQAFVNDFEAVSTFYNLRELGEYEEAKQAARNDLENAILTYAKLFKEITK